MYKYKERYKEGRNVAKGIIIYLKSNINEEYKTREKCLFILVKHTELNSKMKIKKSLHSSVLYVLIRFKFKTLK